MHRILLGHLNANGDCLYATTIARQLRHDYPDARITWAISTTCSSLLANNADVDDVWQVPSSRRDQEVTWRAFAREALTAIARREFDEVILSQVYPDNFQNFDGTVRPSIFRAYGRPITVPIENVINPTQQEVERVEAFARTHRLADVTHRILFECSSSSGQSFVTPAFANEVAAELYKILPDSVLIFTSVESIPTENRRSLQASMLSLREIALLTAHCSLFVGAGSGGTVAASSTAAHPLPMILLLRADSSVFASFKHDFEYFGVQRPPTIELVTPDAALIAECIRKTCVEGADVALEAFGGGVRVDFTFYLRHVQFHLVQTERYLDAAQSLLHTAGRYGWTAGLIRYAQTQVEPKLRDDPRWWFDRNQKRGEDFSERLNQAARAPATAPLQSPYRFTPPSGEPSPAAGLADTVARLTRLSK
jgi:hypothetical protein